MILCMFFRWLFGCRKRAPRLVLTINGISVELIPHREVKMSVPVNIGHTVTYTIGQVDKNGNPMLTPVAFDAPPTWNESNAALDTFAVSGDALSATSVANAEGTDTITATVVVGGVTYTASVDEIISAAPQVFGGIVLNSTVS